MLKDSSNNWATALATDTTEDTMVRPAFPASRANLLSTLPRTARTVNGIRLPLRHTTNRPAGGITTVSLGARGIGWMCLLMDRPTTRFYNALGGMCIQSVAIARVLADGRDAYC